MKRALILFTLLASPAFAQTYPAARFASVNLGGIGASSILGTGTGLPLETGPTSRTAGDVVKFNTDGSLADSAILASSLATVTAYTDCASTATFTAATVGDLSVAYTTQVCKYARIPLGSNYLTFIEESIAFTPTFTTASGNIRFALPVAPVSTGLTATLNFSSTPLFTWPSTATQIALAITNAGSWATLMWTKSASASGTTNISALTSGTAYSFTFSGSYFSQ